MGTRIDQQQGFATELPRERAVVVGVHLPEAWAGGKGGDADLPELGRLVETAGGLVVGELEQRRARPESATFLGSGKLEELKELVAGTEATMVVFDNDLSPAQGRNLEKAVDCKVLDRTELILDIFASHARSRQARLQVELAQLQYLLPRLTRLWSHLEKQAGGIGTRGPGETQLETDRRILGRRLAQLRRELQDVESTRRTQVGSREGLYRAALVGYTNAGKSTLMNGITGADVYVQDQLFATLDATTRRVDADERRRFLLTDTVGFIRKLPHHLVESFKATLEEVREADLMVHVVDASAEDPQHQIDAVNKVLKEIAPQEKPTLMVFNKMDLVDAELFRNRWTRVYPDAVFVRGREPEGTAELREILTARLLGREVVRTVALPITNLHAISAFHRTGAVLEQTFHADLCHATLRLTEEELGRLLSREGAVLVGDDRG
ncbi:MAG: GTPase HflX [Krumholzibacteria bacterium]|nr:GTPase HflX [Candidatus Krumholzibacteria bacterium]